MGRILVVGSLNMDFVISVDDMVKKGQTIMGNGMSLIPGGKGANQAYVIGKLGGEVDMIGAVGNDAYGDMLLQNLKSVNVNTEGIVTMEGKNTGNAIVCVNNEGENSIIVIPGANACLSIESIQKNLKLIDNCDIVLMQLEIPLHIVETVAKYAKGKGKKVILDPAPAPKYLSSEILQYVDIIKPNETELQSLTGMKVETEEQIVNAAGSLIERGGKIVIVTLGERGSMIVTKDGYKMFPSEKVSVVDSTAAGDSFTAAVALALTKDKTYEEAIKFGNRVSSIVVTRKGAQTSIPTAQEVEI